ncbi:MAG: hypothetical protein ACD_73C00348G0007 [uncultured bacterium]|nr:MAG: hypothetical protein ACD_73C00348G0007 [uncultured bacterium]
MTMQLSQQVSNEFPLQEALELFQYATKVRISLLSGLSPSFLSHPHEHYGSHKEFYPCQWTPQAVSCRLAKYSAGGFTSWGFNRQGDMEERLKEYADIINHAMHWAFGEVLSIYQVDHKILASYLGLTIILTEEGLYQWALTL